MLDGEKPEVRFAEQRREIDVLGQLAEAFPEIVSLREGINLMYIDSTNN